MYLYDAVAMYANASNEYYWRKYEEHKKGTLQKKYNVSTFLKDNNLTMEQFIYYSNKTVREKADRNWTVTSYNWEEIDYDDINRTFRIAPLRGDKFVQKLLKNATLDGR